MDKDKIKIDTVIIQAYSIITADMDREKVIMSIDKGKYYGLDAIGSCIWGMIGNPVPVQQIITNLMQEYAVDENTCQKDVVNFLNKMYEEGIIKIA